MKAISQLKSEEYLSQQGEWTLRTFEGESIFVENRDSIEHLNQQPMVSTQ